MQFVLHLMKIKPSPILAARPLVNPGVLEGLLNHQWGVSPLEANNQLETG